MRGVLLGLVGVLVEALLLLVLRSLLLVREVGDIDCRLCPGAPSEGVSHSGFWVVGEAAAAAAHTSDTRGSTGSQAAYDRHNHVHAGPICGFLPRTSVVYHHPARPLPQDREHGRHAPCVSA